MGRTFRSLAVAWVLSFLTLSGIADAQAQYTLTELPVGSFTEVRAFGISANGQIVGGNDALGQAGPLYWSSSTATPTALVPGPGGAAPNEVYGVNSAGQIVDDFVEFPFFWASPTATPTPLSVGAFVQNVGARGINDAGQIVGSRSDGIPLFWASPTSDPTELARETVAAALAFGIANDGAIAGASSSDLLAFAPVVWTSATGAPTALPGTFSDTTVAAGINATGQIVGTDFGAGSLGPSVPLFWASRITAPIALPTGSYTNVAAWGINDAGDIVGYGTANGSAVPLLWTLATPAALLGQLTTVVDTLTNIQGGSGFAGYTQSLTQKLANALAAIQAQAPSQAVNVLNAFVHAVQAQSGKKLTVDQADGLIASAQAIITALQVP